MEYDNKVLRKLQLAQCEVFKDFIKICEEHNIEYFLFSGCAIGVERHGGFIPWDDDIDIGMRRKEYDKFREIAKKEYTEKYRLLDMDVDPKFPFFNANFIRRGTVNVPKMYEHLHLDTGIDVALYPFDNVADNKLQRFHQCFWAFFWHKIRTLQEFDTPYVAMSGWKKSLVLGVCKFIHNVLKVLHISKTAVNKKYLKHATRYNDRDTELITSFFATKPLGEAVFIKELYPLKDGMFEGFKVKIPCRNDQYLTRMYGDYMKLPPEEYRKNHIAEKLDFGPFDQEIQM
jgi:lipopolysaccharide cholinephosphotransferase